MGDCDILQFLKENDIIIYNAVQDSINLMKKQEFLSKHDSKIWQGSDGYWRTYLPLESGRKLIKKKNYEDIENVIIEYYKEISTIKLDDVFQEWIGKKYQYGEIMKQTYDRYTTDYGRFFTDSVLKKKEFSEITNVDIEEFCKSTISDMELTAKSWSGLRLLLNGIWKYGKRHDYTQLNISTTLDEMQLSSKAFKKVRKEPKELIFNETEEQLIESYILNQVEPSIINYGILLAFQTGLRSGELSALTVDDIKDNYIRVCKTEERYKDSDGRYVFGVRDSTKTDAGMRNVIIPTKTKKILYEISKMRKGGSTWLFEEEGRRIKEKAFTVKLYKICNSLNIPKRSLNKCRKTYATRLIDGNIQEKIVTSQLGHVDISTTKGFYYINNANTINTIEQLDRIFG